MKGGDSAIAPAIVGRGLGGIQSNHKAAALHENLTEVVRHPHLEVKGKRKHGATRLQVLEAVGDSIRDVFEKRLKKAWIGCSIKMVIRHVHHQSVRSRKHNR